MYSTDSSRSKPSSAASTLWRLALVPDDDWEAASAVVTNGSLKASRKMIFGDNLSFARVAGGGIEGCVVGTGVGRCTWEAVYSANSPRSKPSSAAYTLWRLALVPDDDWEAASAAVTNGSLKADKQELWTSL